jgi:ketosteroid isomerase-like protein
MLNNNTMKSFCLNVVLISSFVSGYGQGAVNDVNQFINAWHMAASNADATTFFESMAEDAVYIGTDATERWTKSEFVTFAKPYFDRGKAWDFKPRDRDIHVTSDGQSVWFSELLDTWMGVCRGSGVLVKTGKGWKLQQYHLSVTVPNAIIKEFITLVDDFEKKEKH